MGVGQAVATAVKSAVLNELNAEQNEAVRHDGAALLVLAGAGTGKTRVLAHRAAFLVRERGVDPRAIAAVTFTNKAADEMRDRIATLLGATDRGIWVGTFHAFSLRILKRHIDRLGYKRDFTVYDETDQRSVMRRILKSSPKFSGLKPANVLGRISWFKQKPGPASAELEFGETLAAVFELYQDSLRESNALDFDDLLVLSLRLFEEHPDVLLTYQNRYQHMLIDEYQDTSHVQFMLASKLCAAHRNIFAVGDEDQSIYAWRGADIRNILDFGRDFPDAKIVRLERNYRSAGNILAAANAVVSNNVDRLGKNLWTDLDAGEKVRCHIANNGQEEAIFVASQILSGGGDFRDYAVLFRTAAQSRAVEEALLGARIPYQVVAGVRFYERKEVKDVLCYLRLAVNTSDDVSLRRALGVSKSGIGEKTAAMLARWAGERGAPLYTALEAADQVEGLTPGRRAGIAAFTEFIGEIRESRSRLTLVELVKLVIDKTRYRESIEQKRDVGWKDKIEILDELVAGAEEFGANNQDASLESFLERTAIGNQIDGWDGSKGAAALMTIHSAKGLEFPVVFIVGVEEGLLPHQSAFDNDAELEEERRLCYVAATRAARRLYLTCAMERVVFGKTLERTISRFVNEIPENLLEMDHRPTGFSISAESSPALGDKVEPDELTTGARVEHAKWGRGTVMYKSGKGDKMKVKIKFDRGGKIREFLAGYLRLLSVQGSH